MRIESLRSVSDKLNSDEYSCNDVLRDCPFFGWNTCPLCLCGLMPVFVVCLSALLHKDYVTHVTESWAKLASVVGLSYTVHHTSACIDQVVQAVTMNPQVQVQPCNPAHGAEVAAAEYDFTGSTLLVRNITRVRAKRLTAVKATPDWRFVVFIGSVQQPPSVEAELNLWVVSSIKTNEEKVAPIFSPVQIDAMETHCRNHAGHIYAESVARLEEKEKPKRQKAMRTTTVPPATNPDVEEEGKEKDRSDGHHGQGTRRLLDAPRANLVGFKNLQVVPHPFFRDQLDEAADPTKPRVAVYRIAISMECEADMPPLSNSPSDAGSREWEGSTSESTIYFSQLAVVDFELLDFNQTSTGFVRSALLPLNLSIDTQGTTKEEGFNSQSCPRFIPTSLGQGLLFVAEHASPLSMPGQLPTERGVRRVAVTKLPQGGVIKSDAAFQASWLAALTGGEFPVPSLQGKSHKARMIVTQHGSLPQLPSGPSTVDGCAEFVPNIYHVAKSITDTVFDSMTKIRENLLTETTKEKPGLEKSKYRKDTFVFTSNTLRSRAVLDVDAQVIAASLLDQGTKGEVSDVLRLYDVKAMPELTTSGMHQLPANSEERMLMLEGCKPIRAAGRKGHMRLEWAFETLMRTMNVQSGMHGYSTWLSCLTADGKVAIVQSPKRSRWVNMTITSPGYAQGALAQNVWCERKQEDGCFEVWSNPNPNEMAT